ncbi:MAG: hypothetical protein MR616_05735 [Pyramidobacter sp.]|nr:hypothetical protein [Pyramidobacter sp.]
MIGTYGTGPMKIHEWYAGFTSQSPPIRLTLPPQGKDPASVERDRFLKRRPR